MTHHSTNTAGIDTGKQRLHLSIQPADERLDVKNAPEGFAVIAAALERHGIVRVGIESTSIYHEAVSRSLRQAGFEVVVLQPGQVKAWAKVKRRKAKNDRLDGDLVGGCAAEQEEVHPPRPAELEPLVDHLTYIEQLEEDLACHKTRRERFSSGPLKLEREIKRLGRIVRSELKVLEAKLRKSEDLARRLDLALSVSGVGMRSALAAVIRMPELGRLTREKAAALLGVAPMDDDSGTHVGQRFIKGGRARARKSLFMAAFAGAMRHNAYLRAIYVRLTGRGKPHTLAVIACTRKLVIILNTVLARGTPWIEKTGTPCPQC